MAIANLWFTFYIENIKADEYFLAVCGWWELVLFGQYWKENNVFWTILNGVGEIKSYMNCPGWLWRPRVLHAILSLRQKSQSKSQFLPPIRISTTYTNFYHQKDIFSYSSGIFELLFYWKFLSTNWWQGNVLKAHTHTQYPIQNVDSILW